MKISWSSPSNIALVKYWGKYGDQLPRNPSISFTLKYSKTLMSVDCHLSQESLSLNYSLEGKENIKFASKIEKFLKKLESDFPWLKNSKLSISSSNSFPHSAGIASSASSMSALCLCLLSLNVKYGDQTLSEDIFYKIASSLSRRASGSAARSVYGGVVLWGVINDSLGSNDFAEPITSVHPVFENYCDSILIVDSREKTVSSREGHALMDHHPYASARFEQALINSKKLLEVLKSGDISSFISIVEQEALSLHALMMSSNPSYILLRPESLKIIESIKNFRNNKQIPVCFTIDAGPNIHLLYPKYAQDEVKSWIALDLMNSIPHLDVIHDEVGAGPERLEFQE